MPVRNERQTIEIFRLLFLRTFGARVHKALFALKGGCNLRFFLKSIRYSEDMDLVIHTMSVGTLRNNVNRLLEAPSFAQALRAQGIEIVRTSFPKQTETTQRWRLTLRITESGAEIPTKFEFSRRGLGGEKAVEPVDAGIIRTYRLYPVIVQHYSVHSAFAGQVLAFLEPEYQEHYRNRKVWAELQEQIADGLEALGT